MADITETEETIVQRRSLSRHRATATALLVVMGIAYFARLNARSSRSPWTGFIR